MRTLRVLALAGSPRKNANSTILVEYAVKPFEEQKCDIKVLHICDLDIKPCRGCDSCRMQGICVINDDMAKVIEAFRWCDILIVGTPVYFRTVNAHLLAILQRYYCEEKNHSLKGKLGGAIAVGRGTGGGQAIAINTIFTWMLSAGIICVPGELNGVTALADGPGEILNQPRKLDQALYLGKNLLELGKRLIPEVTLDFLNV